MEMRFLPKDVFQVIAEGKYRVIEEFDNYNKAFEIYNALKTQPMFGTVELFLIRKLEEVTKDGNDDE